MRAMACMSLFACLIVQTHAFHCTALHLLPKPTRTVSISWCPAKICKLYGEHWPKPAFSAYAFDSEEHAFDSEKHAFGSEKHAFGSEKHAFGSEKHPPRITADMKRLQEMVRALCCVLMFSDDIALMEREASKIEHIYFDLSSNVSRRPALLRSNLAAFAQEYNIELHAPPRKWHSVLKDPFDSV